MEEDNILTSLNEHQILGVTTTEGRVRVVAGAGSGKTRVLAHRFAYLVNDLGIAPGNILCMTFTNKAAWEMRDRISRLTDTGNVNDLICTLHGFCVKFLRREIYRIGFPKTFAILDEPDAKQMAKLAMDEFGIDRRKNTAERFLAKVAAVKGYDPDAYIQRHFLPGAGQDPADAVVRYIQLQLKHMALDFDDLIYITIYILEHFEEARIYWTQKLNYIMVDEVQDCSADDWRLMRLLATGHNNLFVVGDPDQAIYEWRGARPKLFIDFDAEHTVMLTRNYRSSSVILDAANAVIANNHNRIPKDLYTTAPEGVKVVHYHARSENEEAEWIADRIEKGLAAGAKPNDFAILYRASHVSRAVEQALLRHQIAYTVWGGVRFYDRREIKDLMAYLRLIVNPDDDLAFERIVNLPSRRFGKTSLGRLRKLAESEGRSLYQTLALHIDDAPFAKPPLRDFLATMEKLRLLEDMLSVTEMTDEMLKTTGLGELLRTDTEEERLENVTELIASMREFERRSDEPSDGTTSAWLQEVALYTNLESPKRSECVRMMTIHQSKGLEFPTVFICGLTEGIFPAHRSIRERRKDGEEEERRLMYVAVTRAMQQLCLTESEGPLNDGSSFKYPSRFLTEVPDALLVREGEWDESLLKGTRRMMKNLEDELCGDAAGNIPVGSRVRHKIFGEGVVEEYHRADDTYLVRFGQATRNLLPRALQVIDAAPEN